MWRIFHWKTNGFSFFSVQWAHRNSCQDSQYSAGMAAGCSLAPRLHDREHAGWGLCRPGFPSYMAVRPPVLALQLLSLPSLLPVSTCSTEWCFTVPFWATSGNGFAWCSASSTYPAPRGSFTPAPCPYVEDSGKRRKDQGTKGVDCSVLFIYFLSFFFSFKSASLWDQNNRQCRVTNHVILLVEQNVLPPQEGVYVIVYIL